MMRFMLERLNHRAYAQPVVTAGRQQGSPWVIILPKALAQKHITLNADYTIRRATKANFYI